MTTLALRRDFLRDYGKLEINKARNPRVRSVQVDKSGGASASTGPVIRIAC